VTERISLALIIHNHQPVGNFGWVIGDVFEKAYEPLIGALERHPDVRLALHYSGPLLEWIAAEQPEFLARLHALVARDQVEIVGGAMYEPILPALPERDRVGQLSRMRADLERRFGRAPTGAWLAERVWEPSLPASLAEAGYTYTVLDDNHLRGAFVPEDEMWGTYTTDDQGRMLTIFGTEKGLRYLIPWHPVPELIEFLRRNATEAGERLGIMGDDGEKFGAWPGTHELCWSREEWVERCFGALEQNADWLTTVTPTQWMAGHAPIGRIYVPSSSYVEMTEWALPVAEAPAFHELMSEAAEANSPAVRFLRGAMWRNFQARYREVNDMHKQMLRVSDVVAALPAGPARDTALRHLHRGQSNDCYWHGLFGGIYIVHMRMATLAELIAAEDAVLGAGAAGGVADFDLDGLDEVLLGTSGQSVLVDLAEGAGIGAWDLRATRLALASVMRRRPEAYHATLRSVDADASAGDTAEASNPHEIQHARQSGLAELLVYDDHERRSGLVRVLRSDGAAVGALDRAEWLVEEVSGSRLAVARQSDGLAVRKTITLGGGRLSGELTVAVEISAVNAFEGQVEAEWNINLLGGGGNPAAHYRSEGDEWRHDSQGAVAPGAGLSFGNDFEGAEISVTLDPPAAQEWFAVQTVSNSESGFEAVYQGSCLVQRWPLRLAPGDVRSFAVRLAFSQSRDRAAEEAG
jgi:4-alpha-glucanotransferase